MLVGLRCELELGGLELVPLAADRVDVRVEVLATDAREIGRRD